VAVIAAASAIGFSVWFVMNRGSVSEVTEDAVIGTWQTDDGGMYFEFSKSGTVYTRDEDWNTTIGLFEVTDGSTITVNYSDSSDVYEAKIKNHRLHLITEDGEKIVLNKALEDKH